MPTVRSYHCQTIDDKRVPKKLKARKKIHHTYHTSSHSTSKLTMTEMKRVLIFGGKTGWIGGLMAELIKKDAGE